MEIKIQKSTVPTTKDIFGKFAELDHECILSFEIAYLKALIQDNEDAMKHPEIGINAYTIAVRTSVGMIFSKISNYLISIITDGRNDPLYFAETVYNNGVSICTHDINMYISGIINKYNAPVIAAALAHTPSMYYWKWDEKSIHEGNNVCITISDMTSKINTICEYLQSMIKFGELCYHAMIPTYTVNYNAAKIPLSIADNYNKGLYSTNNDIY